MNNQHLINMLDFFIEEEYSKMFMKTTSKTDYIRLQDLQEAGVNGTLLKRFKTYAPMNIKQKEIYTLTKEAQLQYDKGYSEFVEKMIFKLIRLALQEEK